MNDNPGVNEKAVCLVSFCILTLPVLDKNYILFLNFAAPIEISRVVIAEPLINFEPKSLK